MIRKNRWIVVAAIGTAAWLVGAVACGGSDTAPHDVTASGTGGSVAGPGVGPGPGSGPGSGAGSPTSTSTVTGTGGSGGSGGSGGNAGNGGSGGGPADCFMHPTTHLEIINACTDAARVDKHPNLPLLEPDGGLPPLP